MSRTARAPGGETRGGREGGVPAVAHGDDLGARQCRRVAEEVPPPPADADLPDPDGF